jgi:hypothetical protein
MTWSSTTAIARHSRPSKLHNPRFRCTPKIAPAEATMIPPQQQGPWIRLPRGERRLQRREGVHRGDHGAAGSDRIEPAGGPFRDPGHDPAGAGLLQLWPCSAKKRSPHTVA